MCWSLQKGPSVPASSWSQDQRGIEHHTLSNKPIPHFLHTKLIISWPFAVEISKKTISKKCRLKFKKQIRHNIFCLRLWPNRESSPKQRRRYHKGTVCTNCKCQRPFWTFCRPKSREMTKWALLRPVLPTKLTLDQNIRLGLIQKFVFTKR